MERRRKVDRLRDLTNGIVKAASLPLRFYLGGSEFVSKRERAGKSRSV